MKKISVRLLALFLVWPTFAFAQATTFLKIDDIQPGMKGIGKTVFKGRQIEEFQCEILGVLRNIGPNQNAIIARLSGKGLENTGIFAGMSGSPVYIDGRMIGAVAWSFPFLKEPIAGITPIQEMIDVFQEGSRPPRLSAPARRGVASLWEAIYGLEQPMLSASDHDVNRSFTLPDALVPDIWSRAGEFLPRLRHIATPISFSGFDLRAVQRFAPQFQFLGLTPQQGGAGVGQRRMSPNVPLEPGATVTVSLITGDMDVSASGTVTYRDGDTVYAFGHPFMNVGTTNMPLGLGEVLAVLPSLENSQKLSVGTDLIGSIKQDRSTGIRGVVGEPSELIPVSVSVVNQENRRREFKYTVINDQFLTPFLLNLTIFNTIISSERGLGYSTLRLKGRIAIDGQEDIRIENSFSSNSNSPVSASLAVAAPVSFLLASGYEDLRVKDIALEIDSFEDSREVLLERVWFDRTEVKPGGEVKLDVFLRKGNGENIMESYPIKIGEDIPVGPLSILVGDGESMERNDARQTPINFIPRDLSHLVRLINNLKKQDRLYVRLFRRETGAVVQGEGLPGLPPSISALLRSPKTQGGINPINISTFVEYELPPTDFVISGMKMVTIQVRP